LEEEIKREGRDLERWREKRKEMAPWRGASGCFFFSMLLHYLQLQKISFSKMNLPIKRLGYDAGISSSISQVESLDMRSHNTFTMGILLP